MDIKGILSSGLKTDPEEEKRLWDEYRADPDNSEAIKRLVEIYIPLVASVANKMPMRVREKVPVKELLSSGVIGLHHAISSYSDDRQVLFSTFAYKRIKGAIIDDLRAQDHLTRTQRNYYREICAAINKLTIELSRPPTDSEIAEATNLSIANVDRYIGMGHDVVNLDEEFRDGLSYMDVLPDHKALSPAEAAHRSLALDKLREHFRDLEEREQKLLFLRHFEEMSVKEIAKVLEVSEGRISQIYQKIVLKLRALMRIDETL